MLKNQAEPVVFAVVAIGLVERKDVALGTSLSVKHPPIINYKILRYY